MWFILLALLQFVQGEEVLKIRMPGWYTLLVSYDASIFHMSLIRTFFEYNCMGLLQEYSVSVLVGTERTF